MRGSPPAVQRQLAVVLALCLQAVRSDKDSANASHRDRNLQGNDPLSEADAWASAVYEVAEALRAGKMSRHTGHTLREGEEVKKTTPGMQDRDAKPTPGLRRGREEGEAPGQKVKFFVPGGPAAKPPFATRAQAMHANGLHRAHIWPGPGNPAGAFKFGTAPRAYLLYVPSKYATHKPIPLWVLAPGDGVRMETLFKHNVHMAEQHTYAIVMLSGYKHKMGVGYAARNTKHRPDDVAYTRVMLRQVLQKISVDMRRISCVGFSRGARFCSRLASELTSFVSSIAAVGGLRYPDPNNASRPVPIIAFHGTADTINPYWGGGPRYWVESIPDVVKRWSNFNGCQKRTHQWLNDNVEITYYSNCKENADITFVKLQNWGHGWPNRQTINARMDILHFLWKHPQKTPCYTVAKAMPYKHCYGHIMWAKNHGVRLQPKVYHGLTYKSPMKDFQQFLHERVFSDCPLPCKDVDLVPKASELWGDTDREVEAPRESKGPGVVNRGAPWLLAAVTASAAAACLVVRHVRHGKERQEQKVRTLAMNLE